MLPHCGQNIVSFLATELGADTVWQTQSVSAKDAGAGLEAFRSAVGPIVQKRKNATNRSEQPEQNIEFDDVSSTDLPASERHAKTSGTEDEREQQPNCEGHLTRHIDGQTATNRSEPTKTEQKKTEP
jgi:hypothetical protein